MSRIRWYIGSEEKNCSPEITNMKKSLNRVARRAEEYLTSPEKTDLEENLQRQLNKAVLTKDFMVKMLDNIESIVGTKTSTKEQPTERLGHQMIATGNELGTTDLYGASLVQVGEYEKRLGKEQRVFFNMCIDDYLIPMRAFLDGDMKALLNEMSALEKKRLDLDSCKKRQRKADPKTSTPATERALVAAQAEYDRLIEVVQLLANRVEEDQTKHVELLHKFVEIQLNYYHTCSQIISELHKEVTGEKAAIRTDKTGEHSGGASTNT